jgi:hypothetical protein
MVAHPGGEQTKADDAVGDHHVVQHGHFFAQQLVAFALHHGRIPGRA